MYNEYILNWSKQNHTIFKTIFTLKMRAKSSDDHMFTAHIHNPRERGGERQRERNMDEATPIIHMTHIHEWYNIFTSHTHTHTQSGRWRVKKERGRDIYSKRETNRERERSSDIYTNYKLYRGIFCIDYKLIRWQFENAEQRERNSAREDSTVKIWAKQINRNIRFAVLAALEVTLAGHTKLLLFNWLE